MEPYQKFVEVFKHCCDEILELKQLAIKSRMEVLKKKYKTLCGIEDEEKIIALEEKKNRQLNRELKLYLQLSHVYEIDDKHKFLLMLTNNPKEKEDLLWKQVRLPFPEVFIDVSFTPDDNDSLTDNIYGFLIKEMKDIIPKVNRKGKDVLVEYIYGLKVYTAGMSKDGHVWIDDFRFPITTTEDKQLKTHYTDRNVAQFIKKFIVNFLLFLKDREVVFVERNRSKGNIRRVRDNKTPLPNSQSIKLMGEIKRYVDSISDNSFKGKLSYKFWVSGHYRTYRSDKYKTMKNRVQWIVPYVKGQGFMVKKRYVVEPEDDPNILHYEDIK
tara:strand:+ start:1601 stop:2578 length:978 start_codon:yes stop_codon:yes gene_type:complete